MKNRSCKTVILTSRENFRWLSMQEIIPLIEKNWLASHEPGSHEVLCRNVDQISISDLMPDLVSADNIVFACFTVKLARIGELLRKDFALDARYFIYLHNQATIACWPYHVWGMGGCLRESDVFISTSKSDAKTFRHSFRRGRVEVVPFTLTGIKREYPVPAIGLKEIPFVYVGRLSVQKNLHTLLAAFKLFKDSNPSLPWKLTIYGKDDDLGSPNMGITSKNYGKTLRELSRKLGLQKQVIFKGYKERTQINRALNKKLHISVSASVHSDENFGMAPFRSIARGNLAVLSRWGGYADFGTQFSKRVFLTPVEETSKGPTVDPVKFARQMSLALKEFEKMKAGKVVVPGYYQENSISERLFELAREKFTVGRRLKMATLAKRVLKNKTKYRNHSCKIFESYSDPDAKTLFRSYGMS